MGFGNYTDKDYDEVCKFLVELCKDRHYINWNWARFEWMIAHPETDQENLNSIGLWWDGGKVVGAAIYDMYFGEAFCGVLPKYESLYPEVLEYTYQKLSDDSGVGIAICDDNIKAIKVAQQCGFQKATQTENIMKFDLTKSTFSGFPEGISVKEFDPAQNPYEFAWLIWQGFDHGQDKEQFEKEDENTPQIRKNLNKNLSLAAVNDEGDIVAYVCLWYNQSTGYAYVEPVCCIPNYRKKGIAKALLHEAFHRVKKLGAKEAIVISDMDFYKKLGFENDVHFTFYWKA